MKNIKFTLAHILWRHIRFMAACYIISRSVGRISRTQPIAATNRHHQHTGHEWLPDTCRAPQNTGNPARRAGQNVPPAQMARHHCPFRQHPALD